MFRFTKSLRALVVGALFVAVGCSDLPTAAQPEIAASNGLLGDLVEVVVGTVDTVVEAVVGVLSPVLARSESLEEDEVASAWIGRSGGTISLPRAGLTVTIPRGALNEATRITVTAPAGDLYGYEFAPHGLRFERPVTLTQEMPSVPEGGVEGIYFDGDLEPTVTVLEVFRVSTSRDRVSFRIDHFSGYAYRQSGYVVATD